MKLTEEKILNGIKYFVANTKNVGRTKLFKLLYFWDFIHFKRYGLSVTGYDYYTLPFGPVPRELYDKISRNDFPQDFKKEIEFNPVTDNEEEDTDTYKTFSVLLKNRKIDLDVFSPNELSVLKEVAEIYKNATAKQMTEVAHLPNTPWAVTMSRKGLNQPIDYFLSLDNETPFDRETIEERFKLQQDLLSDGRI